MKEIRLTQGFVALIDDEDYKRVSALNWAADVRPNTVYATAIIALSVGQWINLLLKQKITITKPE